MRLRIVFLVVSIAACLVSGWLIGRPGLTLLTPTAAPVVTGTALLEQQQVCILLLGVETRAAAHTPLDSVWVLKFSPGIPNYYLIGFPTNTLVQEGLTLTDYYNVGANLTDAGHFVSGALEVITNHGLVIQHRVVMDRATLTQFVDEVGGLTLDAQTMDGATLMAQYAALPADDAATELQFQQRALQALTDAVVAQAWPDDRLHAVLAAHRSASPDAEVLLALALQAVHLGQPRFYITTYQPPAAP
ncbi:MAG: hypothetical protein ACT4QE_00880 [Anaerolineales bacterium]